MSADQPAARSSDAAITLAATIAQQLGETEALPRRQIRRTVEQLGAERAQALLVATQAVEVNGGVLLPDGSRRRTPGGVFFHLVRQHASPEQTQAIFHPQSKRPAPAAAPSAGSAAPAPNGQEDTA